MFCFHYWLVRVEQSEKLYICQGCQSPGFCKEEVMNMVHQWKSSEVYLLMLDIRNLTLMSTWEARSSLYSTVFQSSKLLECCLDSRGLFWGLMGWSSQVQSAIYWLTDSSVYRFSDFAIYRLCDGRFCALCIGQWADSSVYRFTDSAIYGLCSWWISHSRDSHISHFKDSQILQSMDLCLVDSTL